jgi:hypothetical protein
VIISASSRPKASVEVFHVRVWTDPRAKQVASIIGASSVEKYRRREAPLSSLPVLSASAGTSTRSFAKASSVSQSRDSLCIHL